MDQTRDVSGQQLYRLTRLYGPPEFVKEAGVGDLCGGDELPPHVYGDPRRRLFPCHTPAACWTSAAFFLDKEAEFRDDAPLIWGRILHCARVFGVDKSLAGLREKVAANVPSPDDDLPDEDFALVSGRPDGTAERRYPLRNPAEVKRAAAYLAEHRDSFPYEDRREFADRVLQKAARMGVRLGGDEEEFLTKQAGHGACTAREAAELLLGRFHAVRMGPGPAGELQKGILKLAEMVARTPSRLREPGMRVKLARTVDDFDRATGLAGKYGPALPRPEDVLFGLTREKMAQAAQEHTHTVTGNIYRLADLERVRVEDVRDLMGDDFARELTSDGLRVDSEKAAAVVPTLPRGDAEMFDRLMRGVGVMPMAKEASSYSVGVGRDYLRQLAGQGGPR